MTMSNVRQALESCKIEKLPLNILFSDPKFNIRGEVLPGDVVELSERLNESGLMHPLIVQRQDIGTYKYRIISGNRRYAAAKLLNWETIECKILVGLTDEDAEDLNYEENASRQDLSLAQQAKAVQRNLIRGYSLLEISKKFSESYDWVKTRKLYLSLPEDIQVKADQYDFPDTSIKQLAELQDEGRKDDMYTATRILIDKRLAGERVTIKLKSDDEVNKEKESKAKERSKQDIAKLRDLCLTAFHGFNIVSRTCAWALGDISDSDLLDDIAEEVRIMGYEWEKPKVI